MILADGFDMIWFYGDYFDVMICCTIVQLESHFQINVLKLNKTNQCYCLSGRMSEIFIFELLLIGSYFGFIK